MAEEKLDRRFGSGYKLRRSIEDKLHEVLIAPENGSEFYSYATGYSDVRMAVDFGCSKHIVKGVRRQMFGALKPRKIEKEPDLLAPVEGFEARLAAVEATLLDIRTKLASLLE